MAILKCKMCGGSLNVTDENAVCECEFCGTKQTVPKSGNDENIAELFNRANDFRASFNFDKAERIYDQIIENDPDEAEAYWGLILCKFGIEYVKDPVTMNRVPTCHRSSYDPIVTDINYKNALKYANVVQKPIYEKEAKQIDEIQKGILTLARDEEPYDIFLCYKETDASGKRTPDSVLANDIYHQMTNQGYKVFYAAITLEDKLGSAYEPYIFAALNSAKIMLVIGTRPEYFKAVWVKNEWSRYLQIIKKDMKKVLVPCYRDMDAYELPEEFAHLQALDMTKIGFINDIERACERVCGKKNQPKAPAYQTQGAAPSGANVANLIKRMYNFIEDGENSDANEYAEKILDIDCECAEAYIGKLLLENGVKSLPQLQNKKINTSTKTYRAIMKYATPERRAEVEKYATMYEESRYKNALLLFEEKNYANALNAFQAIKFYKESSVYITKCENEINRIKNEAEVARKNEIYDRAISLFNSAKYAQAKREFLSISPFKDSASYALKCDEKIKQITEEQRARELEEKYQKAVNYYENKHYDIALSTFQSISDYKDSKKYIEKLKLEKQELERKNQYDYAVKLYKEENYLEAKPKFALLADLGYGDAYHYVDQCRAGINKRAESLARVIRSNLEARKFKEAQETVRELLKYDSTNEAIYICRLLARYEIPKLDDLSTLKPDYTVSREYKELLRYASPETKKTLEVEAKQVKTAKTVRALVILAVVIAVCVGIIVGVASCMQSDAYIFNVSYENGEAIVTEYRGKDVETLVIPSEIDGKPVTKIGKDAFEYHDFKKVVIPNTVKVIERNAFYSCGKLSEVVIPSSVTKIGTRAFYNCTSLSNVVIPSGVATIDSYAFYYTNIKNIVIPSSVTSMGSYVFNVNGYATINAYCQTSSEPYGWDSSWDYYVDSITWNFADKGQNENYSWILTGDGEIEIIEYIGNEASVKIPSAIAGYPVTKIKKYAFDNKDFINALFIPSSITDIETYGIYYCDGLTNIYIQAEEEPEDWAYNWCYQYYYYDSVTFAYGCEDFGVTENGLSFVRYKSGKVVIAGYNGESEEVTVPDSIDGYNVTAIGYRAFYLNSYIKKVTLPDTVKEIGAEAFYKCSSLEEIVAKGVETVDTYAFYYCEALKNIPESQNIKYIGSYAFAYTELEALTLPKTLETIEYSAFEGIEASGVYIPKSVTSIGRYAFGNKTMEIYCEIDEKPSGWLSTWCNSLAKIYYGVEIVVKSETGFSYVGYTDKTALITSYLGNDSEITIPEKLGEFAVMYFADGLFKDNLTIEKITFSKNGAVISSSMLEGCTNLKEVDLGGVTEIKQNAFKSCSSIDVIKIPETVTTMGSYAFYECYYALIMSEAQERPSGWSSYWRESEKVYSTVWNSDEYGKTDDGFTWVLKNDGTVHIFEYTGNKTQVTVPNKINGNLVNSIGAFAFYDNNILTTVYIGKNITKISAYGFSMCMNLTIYCEASSKPSGWENYWYGVSPYNFNYVKNSGTTNGYSWKQSLADEIEITGYSGTETVIEIPKNINGLPVTKIGYEAFRNKDNLTKVTIGDHILEIDSYAFYDCDYITELTIGNGVERVGSYAFYSCGKLATLNMGTGVKKVDSNAFYNSPVTRVNITDIESWAQIDFYDYYAHPGYYKSNLNLYLNNSLVTKIDFSENIAKIGAYAFAYCYNLTRVSIPKNVTTIGANAFYYCTNATAYIEYGSRPSGWASTWMSSSATVKWGYKDEGTLDYFKWRLMFDNTVTLVGYTGTSYIDLTIPSSINGYAVTKIADYAFESNRYIESVVIGYNVVEIGEGAFSGCYNLEYAYIGDSVLKMGGYIFEGCDSFLEIECEASEPKEGWSQYWNNYSEAVKYEPTWSVS